MKKLLFLALLLAIPGFAQTHTEVTVEDGQVISGQKTYTGNNTHSGTETFNGNTTFTGTAPITVSGDNPTVLGGSLSAKSLTLGSGSPIPGITPRLENLLDGSSSSYLMSQSATTPSANDVQWNGTAQTMAGYSDYVRRIDLITQAGVDVGSSVGLGIFANVHSNNSGGIPNYNNTNQVPLVVNCSVLDTTASASCFAANFIAYSAYTGSIPQRVFGQEIDVNPTRDSCADGCTTGPWAVGALITNNSSAGGTVDGTIGSLIRGSASTHGFKIGNFINGRLVGTAIGTEAGITPDTGLWIRNATTWGIYVGQRAIESSAYFNAGMTLGNPSVGIELGELASSSANSNTLRFTSRDSGGVSHAWDVLTDGATGSLNFAKDGGAFNTLLTSSGIKSASYSTSTNCSSSASPAVCGSAAAGSAVIAAAATTVVVNTSAVTANSQILLTFDSSLGTKLGVTCNTTFGSVWVSARTGATSFTVTISAAPTTNPACFSYEIVN